MTTVPLTRFKEDYIAAFERTKATVPSRLRMDVQNKGGTLVFLVAGSGGRAAVTRGPNGLIPTSDNSQTQISLSFKEAHDKQRITSFNIFASQGDNLKLMRETSLGVIHRQQDIECIATLETGTNTLGTVTADLTLAQKISTRLRNAFVGENDAGNVTCLVTPAAFNTLLGIQQFSSADYTAQKQVDRGIPLGEDSRFWMGITWIAHSGLTGVGTNAATCIAFHRNAAGYATSTRGIDVDGGYVGEDDYSWYRATVEHGAVKLQNSGIIKFVHNDSTLSS